VSRVARVMLAAGLDAGLPCAYRLPFATVNGLDGVDFRVVCAAGSF